MIRFVVVLLSVFADKSLALRGFEFNIRVKDCLIRPMIFHE